MFKRILVAYDGVKRFLLGSVSAHLAVNLDCPVLVVKEKSI